LLLPSGIYGRFERASLDAVRIGSTLLAEPIRLLGVHTPKRSQGILHVHSIQTVLVALKQLLKAFHVIPALQAVHHVVSSCVALLGLLPLRLYH
jgi:hypothetical protein